MTVNQIIIDELVEWLAYIKPGLETVVRYDVIVVKRPTIFTWVIIDGDKISVSSRHIDGDNKNNCEFCLSDPDCFDKAKVAIRKELNDCL